MYIPTTFFNSNGSNIISSGGTQGTFTSGSQLYGYNLFTTPGTSSFIVYSGSVQNARVVVIGGGGGGMDGHDGVSEDFAAGGGGAGGVYINNRITIAPRTYSITVGAGGNAGNILFTTPTVITPPTNGSQSTFEYNIPNNLAAFGGGSGGGAGQGRSGEEEVYFFGATGASGGGNAQGLNRPAINPSTATQGNSGGGIASSIGIGQGDYAYSATGGGGYGAASDGITSTGISATAGGIGVQIPIYPINGNTASYFAGGGGAYGLQPTTTSAGGLGYNTYGGGGTGAPGPEDGRGGLVYIEYPLYPVLRPKYTFLRYDVASNCNLSNPTQVWSYINYSDGFYRIDGTLYSLASSSHINYVTEITTATASSCIFPVTNGLVLWNTSGSFSSSVWYDRSGNSNNASVLGSTMVSTNNGWLFNGTNNYLSYTPNQLNATPSSSFTLQWYGAFPLDGTLRDLFCKDNTIDGWDTVLMLSGSGEAVIFRDQNDRQFYYPFPINTKELYTLVMYNNGPSALNTTGSLYINNGGLVSTRTGSYLSGFNNSASPLKFGFNTQVDGTYLTGSISDILIYNRVLTVDEIGQNYYTLLSLYS